VALAAAAGPAEAAPRETGPLVSVFATIAHSEWCPPGTVRVNFATGRYIVTAPRTWRTCHRPAFPGRITTGVLGARDRAAVEVASAMAATEGLEHPSCRNGGQPGEIYLSNGGDPTLRLTMRGRTLTPPDNRSCWSEAAWQLHRLLRNLFDPPAVRHP
jgi:hypothetical protein